MKKIAIASAAMGGAALIAFGASGTFAAFTDTETATATAGAGTMNLEIGEARNTGAIAPGALIPGQTTTVSYWISNVGNTPGALTATLSITSDKEGSCNDAEAAVENGNCGSGDLDGEFTDWAQVRFLDSTAASAQECKSSNTGSAVYGMGPIDIADAKGRTLPVGTLTANSGNCVVVEVSLPLETGNIVQGDTAVVAVDVTLTQDNTVTNTDLP